MAAADCVSVAIYKINDNQRYIYSLRTLMDRMIQSCYEEVIKVNGNHRLVLFTTEIVHPQESS